ncbi:HDOD domain-containing protein [Spartinivicinus ruber]|uniref:HDOD domain-containing protein n=1 Tax=Spartinivicinus ruber TaxID=2683272 RepID=UPI001E2DE162|nr:HDOD domain-containing protein [Spartinivicinus ruber]
MNPAEEFDLKGVFIPPQPKLMLQINEAGEDLNKIAEIISTDPGIGAQVLKTVNSPAFARTKTINSIHQAVMMLGSGYVTNIINGLMLKRAYDHVDTEALESFWQGSKDVSLGMVLLARQLNMLAVDDAYLIGLFHNCGIPLMLQKFPNYMEICQQSYGEGVENIAEFEDQQLNTNHCIVGYYVAKAWQLNKDVAEIIRDHHHLTSTEDKSAYFKGNEQDDLVCLLKMAEHICKLYKSLGKQDTDYEWEHIRGTVLDHVGLSEPDFLDLQELTREQLGL